MKPKRAMSMEWIFVLSVWFMNHGVPHSLMDDLTWIGKEFFQLLAEEKEKYAIRDFQGYGQIFVVSEEQKRDWGDLLGLTTSPSECKDLNVWPLQPTDFRCTSNIYVRGGKYSMLYNTKSLHDFYDSYKTYVFNILMMMVVNDV